MSSLAHPSATAKHEPITVLNAALVFADLGIPIVPEHSPDPTTATGCDCHHDDCTKPGKHPRTKNGSKDATTDETTIRRWFRMWPHANIGTSLELAGLVIIGPDSIEWAAEFERRGLPPGPVAQSGGGEGHRHYFYRLPDRVPATRICRSGEYDILATGNAILAPSLHVSGRRYEWLVPIVELAEIPYLPDWACEMLRTAAARRMQRYTTGAASPDVDGPPVRLHERGLRRWRGELTEQKPDGSVDRSASLFYVGLDLAECGASERAIVTALAERDSTLGWRKYSDRADPDASYGEIASRGVARATEREQERRTDPRAPAASADDTPEVTRLRRKVLDQDDRLGTQAASIRQLRAELASIWKVIGKRGVSGDDKVSFLAAANVAHSHSHRTYLVDLAQIAGMPRKTIANKQRKQRLFSLPDRRGREQGRADSPLTWRVTREETDPGKYDSILELQPRYSTLVETLAEFSTLKVAPTGRGGRRVKRPACHPDAQIETTGWCCSTCHTPLDSDGQILKSQVETPGHCVGLTGDQLETSENPEPDSLKSQADTSDSKQAGAAPEPIKLDERRPRRMAGGSDEPPRPGDVVVFRGQEWTVEKVEGRTLSLLLPTPRPQGSTRPRYGRRPGKRTSVGVAEVRVVARATTLFGAPPSIGGGSDEVLRFRRLGDSAATLRWRQRRVAGGAP